MWIRKADILTFDELLSNPRSFFPSAVIEGVLPLDAYILAMELAVLKELKKILADQQDPDRKGPVLPFGGAGVVNFTADQIDPF